MRRPFLVLLALLPSVAAAKPADAASLEAFLRSVYTEHLDRMDLDVPSSDAELVFFVADEAGKPMTLRGPDGGRTMRANLAGWKADGWRLESTVSDVACVAGRDLGACTATVSQKFFQHEADQGGLVLRVSLAARWTKAGWALLHLHESPATAP